jgi:hypothetical protein
VPDRPVPGENKIIEIIGTSPKKSSNLKKGKKKDLFIHFKVIIAI